MQKTNDGSHIENTGTQSACSISVTQRTSGNVRRRIMIWFLKRILH